MERKIRVLIAKPGLDGHETGAKVVARSLRDAGMEVIYSGPRQTPEMIVATALQEDVDVIGLSILTGAHKELCSAVTSLLKEKHCDEILVIAGGIIPSKDIPELNQIGVRGVFGPGTDTRRISAFIHRHLPK